MRCLICTVVIMMVAQAIWGAERSAKAKPAKPAQVDNGFAARLYGAVAAAGHENTFFSPASIATALAMTSTGARGETQRQMLEVLGYKDANPDTLHEAFAELIKSTNGQGGERAFQLSMANRLWGQKGFHFLPQFLNQTQKQYGAGLEELDFAHNLDASRQTINAWVEKQTADKIKDLIKPGMLGPDARLVLTNAIYFKGAWADQFKKEMTKDEAFQLTTEQKANAAMMHRNGRYRYAEDDAAQILELPYVNNEVSMVVVLPRKVDGLSEVEKAMDARWLADLPGRLRSRQVQVALPKFKMRAEFELSKVLGSMGMPLAFGPKADFSGISSEEKVAIDDVIHQAYVDVNEEGTEAAAATAVTMRALAVHNPEPPVVFRADHPFTFMIRDTRSGAVLFMGKVMNPAEGK
jgi:serpin B